MELNFDEIEDAQDFTPLDKGRYPMEVVECVARPTQDGSPKWVLTLQVIDSDAAAGKRVFDNIVWKGGGMKRGKLVLGRLGVDTTGTRNIEPDELVGARAMVDVEIDTYTKDLEDGSQVERQRNQVPYAGYHPMSDLVATRVQGGGSPPKDEVPF